MTASEAPRRPQQFDGSFSVECVLSQTDQRYILVTQGDTKVLLRRSLFVGPPHRALQELAERGIELVLPSQAKALRSMVAAAVEPTTTILVADRPGWLTPTAYAYPNGTIVDRGRVVTFGAFCTFRPSAGFRNRGTLQQWQSLFGPLLQKQTLLQGLVCFALSAPLLGPFGDDLGVTDNPMLALVGESSTGKTTALLLLGSLSGISAMETWSTTANALEETTQRHNDGTLVIDEVLLAGGDVQSRDALLRFAPFALASGRGKARMNQHLASAARFVVVTTANTYFVTNARNAAANDVPVQVRMPVIDLVGREHGVLDVALDGDAPRIIEAIRQGARVCGGPPMRRFIGRLSLERGRDLGSLRRAVAQAVARFRAKAQELGPLTSKDERILPRFALAYASGQLAKDWGILPQQWRWFGSGVLQLFRMAQSSLRANAHSDGIARLELGLARIRSRIADQAAGNATAHVSSPFGVIRRAASGHVELLMRRRDFDLEFGSIAGDLLRQLRDCGALATEAGASAGSGRFTVKRVLLQEGHIERVLALRLNPTAYPDQLEVHRME